MSEQDRVEGLIVEHTREMVGAAMGFALMAYGEIVPKVQANPEAPLTEALAPFVEQFMAARGTISTQLVVTDLKPLMNAGRKKTDAQTE